MTLWIIKNIITVSYFLAGRRMDELRERGKGLARNSGLSTHCRVEISLRGSNQVL